RPAPYLAHVVLGHLRSLFNWAINRGTYGLESSPCDRMKPAAIIGPKVPRQRVLDDPELAALWRASEALGYPFGALYRLLLLTGARKSEVELAPHYGWLSDAGGECIGSHAVLHSQDARLELFAHRMMRVLRRMRGDRTSLLGEGEIRVARLVSIHHSRVA